MYNAIVKGYYPRLSEEVTEDDLPEYLSFSSKNKCKLRNL
jgi:hypothetical protein